MYHTTSLPHHSCRPHLSVPKLTNTFPSVHFVDLKQKQQQQQQQQQQIQKQQGGRATGTAVHLPPTADVGSPEEEEEEAGAAMTATTTAERRGDSILEVDGAIADPIDLRATNSEVSTCNDGGRSLRANFLVPS